MATTTKRGFKEKVVQMYELLFKSNNQDLITDSNSQYWNELFLLKPNPVALTALVHEASDTTMATHKHLLNLLFAQAVLTIGSENRIKELNGLVTIFALSRAVFTRPKNKKLDPVDILIGKRDLSIKLGILNAKLWTLLDADNPIELKRIVLHIYLSLLTGYKQYYDNPIVDHLMAEDLFEHLIRLLGIPKLRQQLGELSALVISLLVHFEKSAQVNLFTVKLSILDNEVALNGFAQIICAKLAELNRAYEQKHQHKNAGILSFLTSRMGTMWVRDESVTEDTSLPDFDVFLLLSFYDLVHLSRNFFSLLISAHTDLPEEHYEQESPKTPTNLMVNFLEYCSICMLCNKEKTSSNTLRLCFVILCCITEDQCANALLHDTSLAFKVPLHRVQMRHRKLAEQSDQICRPLAYSLLDLMCEFISSNMRKEFPLDLYLFTVNVIHRLLCYQKRCKIRHEYDWVSLWHTLISLLKYLLQNEELFVKRQMNIFLLAHNVITLLNLSITFGDTFLHSPNAYDELYYEIIRMHQVFNKLLALAFRNSMIEEFATSSMQLVSSLSNIKSIISHFNGKIETFRLANQSNALTEQEVMDIVRTNYDTLTLKLQEGLDMFDTYDANLPNEREFMRKHIIDSILDQIKDKLAAQIEQLPNVQNDLQSFVLQTP